VGIYSLIRDGFQIPQNREALTYNNMGFVEISPYRKIPELINQRFFNRAECVVSLRRETQLTYSIPTLLSASGVIYTDTYIDAAQYLLDWQT
jgi:hypothetical protein